MYERSDNSVELFSLDLSSTEKKRTAKNFSVNQTLLYHRKMSHDQHPPLIWLQLFDSDGQPYKGSSASSLSLNPWAVVDERRQAVVTKNPNMLSSVDAAQLKVFKNKTALIGKEELLGKKSLFLAWECRKQKPLLSQSLHQLA